MENNVMKEVELTPFEGFNSINYSAKNVKETRESYEDHVFDLLSGIDRSRNKHIINKILTESYANGVSVKDCVVKIKSKVIPENENSKNGFGENPELGTSSEEHTYVNMMLEYPIAERDRITSKFEREKTTYKDRIKFIKQNQTKDIKGKNTVEYEYKSKTDGVWKPVTGKDHPVKVELEKLKESKYETRIKK